MFWDLNVTWPGSRAQARTLACMAIQLGYDGIVWTRTVTTKLTPKEVCQMELPEVDDVWKTFGTQQSVLRLKQPDYHMEDVAAASNAASAGAASAAAAASPATAASSSSSPSAAIPKSAYGFQQRTRIHLVIEDASLLHSLNITNPALQSYDIVSVASSQEKLFHAACQHESVDIVVVEASRKLPFYLKKPAINLALERSIHFEFSYSPSIRDSTSRRWLFANVLSMIRLSRGRNLILTSAATKEMELRAPWDVINLGVLCGIDPALAKASITAHARAVLLHAEARKTMKCVLREVKLDAPVLGISSSLSTAHHPKPKHTDEETRHKDKRSKLNK